MNQFPPTPHDPGTPAGGAIALPTRARGSAVQRVAAQRLGKVQQRVHRVGSAGSGGMSPMRLLLLGAVLLVLLGAGAVMSGAVHLTRPDDGRVATPGGTDRDGSYSYYHDRDYDTKDTGPKWTTDRTRSTDPNEAVLGDTSRWDYNGSYDYGPYGSAGMEGRTAGTTATDPLYSQDAGTDDVFSTLSADERDPSGGQPVGVPSSLSNPYFDPYGGYSNPYANRIRLAYGPGYGQGAATGS